MPIFLISMRLIKSYTRKNLTSSLLIIHYALNKRDSIVEHLSYYFSKLAEGGIFYVGDFTND